MDKYIGFDIDTIKTVVCVIEKGKKDKFYTIGSDVDSMVMFLQKQQQPGKKLHLTFEISGQAGYWYDTLIEHVDTITVSNPSKMTWIYRTAKKNDRLDAVWSSSHRPCVVFMKELWPANPAGKK